MGEKGRKEGEERETERALLRCCQWKHSHLRLLETREREGPPSPRARSLRDRVLGSYGRERGERVPPPARCREGQGRDMTIRICYGRDLA